ncbi:MAG TPA: hypothetical protein VF556_09005 [Pyrinomonadaceae bacterium]|jgi:hypothetical protein
MNNAPRDTLRQIIAKHGTGLCSDARRVEGLLKDLSGGYRREINVLTSALEERVPLDLLAAGKSVPRELLLTKLAKRLEDNLGLTEEAAHWAVDSWALAIGVVTDAEISEKEKKQNENTKQTFPSNIDSITEKTDEADIYNNPTSTTRPPQTKPRTQPPANFPPIVKAPVNPPAPLPKVPPQTKNQNINFPQSPAQSINPSSNSVPKRRFGKLFGCLFILIFLALSGVVLLFGVPYAINVMRETQRSEPPRFPPR